MKTNEISGAGKSQFSLGSRFHRLASLVSGNKLDDIKDGKDDNVMVSDSKYASYRSSHYAEGMNQGQSASYVKGLGEAMTVTPRTGIRIEFTGIAIQINSTQMGYLQRMLKGIFYLTLVL